MIARMMLNVESGGECVGRHGRGGGADEVYRNWGEKWEMDKVEKVGMEHQIG
jgi:hypothetical protein